MPSYTTMSTGSRTRIMRLRPNHDAHTVTSVNDPSHAKAIANALSTVGTDLPFLVGEVLAATGVELPDPTIWEYDSTRSDRQWLTEPAPIDPIDVSRRALALFDGPADPRYVLKALAAAVAGQPEAVRRAVRDELLEVLRDYDDVPVVAYASDYKWNDCSWSLIITGALAQMDRTSVESLVRSANAGATLDVLASRGDVEVPASVTSVADQGYLRVDAHPAQMTAWLTRHHPDLVAVYAEALSLSGVLD